MPAAPAQTWVDGKEQVTLTLPDRGLDYGDGLFETLLVREGNALHLDLHMNRLKLGLEALGFPACLTLIETQVVGALSASAVLGEAVMRVTVTRGEGKRGYAPPKDCHPRVIITLTAYPKGNFRSLAAPATLGLAKIRWSHQPALAGIKHLNRLDQVLASREWAGTEVDEAVMLDQFDNVVSVSAGNLFIFSEGVLHTPALLKCGVRGTRRRLVLESLAPKLRIATLETEISLEQLREASEVFYCNALQGFRPVARFDNCSWDKHPVCNSLHKLYVGAVL